jgi:hypothetical protein
MDCGNLTKCECARNETVYNVGQGGISDPYPLGFVIPMASLIVVVSKKSHSLVFSTYSNLSNGLLV